MYFTIYVHTRVVSQNVVCTLRAECPKMPTQPCLEHPAAEVRLRLRPVDVAAQVQRPHSVRAVRDLGAVCTYMRSVFDGTLLE